MNWKLCGVLMLVWTGSFAQKKVELESFEDLVQKSKLKGGVLIYDVASDTYYSNNFEWAERGFIPASTFKIPNSINAIENGLVQDEHTMFYWDGVKRRKSWDKDMEFLEAFRVSCVPCYQQIARKTGYERMQAALQKLNYPGMVFKPEELDQFWLSGASKISQMQQIDFIKRLVEKKLPIKEKTVELMSKLMYNERHEGYELYGKTGWATNEGTEIGWFVGYAVGKDQIYYFATNLQPAEGFDMDDFPAIRKSLSIAALDQILSK